MSIALIVTRGYGNGTLTGDIAHVVTRGYDIGAEVATVEAFSGGYEVWKYRPRVRFKFKDEEEKEAAQIIEDVAEVVLNAPDNRIKPDYRAIARDMELALRLKLHVQDIEYKKIYGRWLKKEIQAYKSYKREKEIKRRRKQEEELIIFMLH